jgi:hypothetical protein
MKTGIELITEERKEQVEKHGYTLESDLHYGAMGQLNFAANALGWQYDIRGKEVEEENRIYTASGWVPAGWDKDVWVKMVSKPYKERLIIAAALLAAEIDRLNNKP